MYNKTGDKMEVYDLRPRGFCHGVARALQIVKKATLDDTLEKPLYILGLIVHNKKLKEALNELGVVSLEKSGKTRLELVDEIKEGTAILTAHGVSELVKEKLAKKKIPYIDATCKDVYHVHDHIKEHLDTHEIIYIGKKDHPEVEGVLGLSSEITLVTNTHDASLYLKKTDKPIYVTNQTTLSLFDVFSILQELEKRYQIEFDNDICKATTMRQEAVIKQPKSDLLLVVGDSLSSNSNKLKEVSIRENTPSYRIETVDDISIDWLLNINSVNVTSGASTPRAITEEVITFLKNFNKDDKSTWDNKSKLSYYDILG